MSSAQKFGLHDDIAAIATPLVASALAVIRTSGEGSIARVAGVFSRPAKLTAAAGGTAVHGWITGEDRVRVDEVVILVWRAPASFTGEDAVEIFCHGGVAVVQAVYKLLLQAGFREARRGEFTLRSFLAGKVDLTQAEATAEIIAGKTREEALMAASRLGGALSERVEGVRRLVVDTLAAVEVEVEYPEDEANFAGTLDLAPLEEARSALEELSSSWKVARLYQEGVRVVLCGKTNAGKSSLFNALLKEQRAITSEQAGTTRDWLEAWADFAGLPVRLFDTAGLREAHEAVEAEGVARTKSLLPSADVVVYVADLAAGVEEADVHLMHQVRDKGIPVVLAANKCDIARAASLQVARASLQGEAWDDAAVLSAKTGAGVESLVDKVKALALGGHSGERGAARLGSERQRLCIDEAAAAIAHAIEVAQTGALGLDAVVQDLEDALSSLSAITGETTTDDILDNIFSRFCVGK